MKQPHLRRIVSIAVTALMASSLMACTDSGEQEKSDTVKIGMLLPLDGPYKPISADIRDAFDLFLKQNGNKLGGRDVEVVVRDDKGGKEPDPKKAAKSAAESAHKLTTEDDVDVIVGGLASTAYVPTAYEASKSKVPFIGMGGITKLDESKVDRRFLWQSSYATPDGAAAFAPYLEKEIDGPVYAIGPNYVGGYTIIEAFTKPFKKLGGELANPDGEPEWTPWPATTDFSESLDKIAQTDAKAIYAYYAGQPSIDFVKQWSKSEAKDIPVYGSYLTDGAALIAQGKSAVGVNNSMNYSPTLDNAANRTFVSQWATKHPERPTNGVALTGWDTGLILNDALSNNSGEVTGEKIATGLSRLGKIESPRGSWQFNEKTHLPIQKWYLTTVEKDGPTLSNVVLEELATLGG